MLLALALHCVGTHVQVSSEPAASDSTPAPDAVGRVVASRPPADAALHDRVVDAAGAPLAGATVCAACAGCNLIQADAALSCRRSRSDGCYELPRLAAGDYLVSAAAEGYLPTRAERGGVISIEERTELDIQLQAAGARVTGVVSDVALFRQNLASKQQLSNLRLQLGPPEPAQPSVPEPGHEPDVPLPRPHTNTSPSRLRIR